MEDGGKLGKDCLAQHSWQPGVRQEYPEPRAGETALTPSPVVPDPDVLETSSSLHYTGQQVPSLA